jgi:hypothetical protein
VGSACRQTSDSGQELPDQVSSLARYQMSMVSLHVEARWGADAGVSVHPRGRAWQRTVNPSAYAYQG